MHKTKLLENISIVLVDTKSPGNIGSTARCMMNMGLKRLLLVNPPEDPTRQAYKLSAGADEIVENSAVFPTLAQALAEHGLVIGTSRHHSRKRKNIHTPRSMSEMVLSLLAKNRIALVFGSEVNGLENSDLALCHEFVTIPSSDEFPSLNLSHAVMICAYELYLASGAAVEQAAGVLAPLNETEGLYLHLQKTLQAIGFLEHNHPDRLMFAFRQIFAKARLSSHDVSMLRGVLSAVDRYSRMNSEKG